MVIIFVELFGVSLGQLIAAITPSVQVGILFDPFIMVILTTFCLYPFRPFAGGPTLSQVPLFLTRWRHYTVSESGTLLERMGISIEPVHATAKRHAIYRAPVRLFCLCPESSAIHGFTWLVSVDCRYAANRASSLFSTLHLGFPVPHGLTTSWTHSEGIWKTLTTPKLVDIASTR